MNAGMTVKINTNHIKKYLVDQNYQANITNSAKLKIDNGTVLYSGVRLSQIDFEYKTIHYFEDDNIKGFAKQMQNIIKREALALGYTEEE